jgi:hypothetical protein
MYPTNHFDQLRGSSTHRLDQPNLLFNYKHPHTDARQQVTQAPSTVDLHPPARLHTPTFPAKEQQHGPVWSHLRIHDYRALHCIALPSIALHHLNLNARSSTALLGSKSSFARTYVQPPVHFNLTQRAVSD